MKAVLLKVWQNKKLVGFVGVMLTAIGGYMTGTITPQEAAILVLGYFFPSPWPTAPKKV